MKPTNFAIDHDIAAYVMVFIITVGGLIAYVGMPREAAPDITIPVVLVTTPYYGVSPSDIETLVTRPIEKELKDLKDVDEIRSTSAEGASIISVTFEPKVDLSEAIQKMREKVDKARPELPEDAEDPVLTEINFSEFPIMLVNIHGDADVLALKAIGEDLKDDIEKVPGVLSVVLAGGLEREVQVEADPKLLDHFGVSLGDILGALRRENVNLPGGSVDVGQMRYMVRVDGEFKDARGLSEIVIKDQEGQPIRIGDVAVINDGYKDRTSLSHFNGATSVSLSVQKRAGENLLRITDEVKVLVEAARAKAPKGVSFTVTADTSVMIRDMVSDLENNILTGLILVVGVLFFFMGGVRNSLFVASAIPLSMFISFLVLDAMGITLNMVVLFSLVLALGMLVDNAIVIVENIYRHASEGKGRVEASRDAVEEVGWPVITSTLTTVVAFAPMMLWPGITGEFMSFLPLTVVVVLVASLFVALIVNPVLCAGFLKASSVNALEGETVPDVGVYRLYKRMLVWSMAHRWLVMAGSAAALIGTFVAYGLLGHGVEFFPETTPKRAFVKVRTPDGSSLNTTEAISMRLEAEIAEMDNIKTFVMNVGAGDPGMGAGGQGQPNRSLFTVDFNEPEDQSEDPRVTMEKVRAWARHQAGADFEVQKEAMGPPGGKPINIEIVGEDYHVLGQLAQEVRTKIKDVEGITDLKDDYVAVRPEIRVSVDRREAALMGVGTFLIADTVRSAINGALATRLRDGQDEIDVIVRLKSDDRRTLEDVRSLTLPGRDGVLIPLREVASLETAGGTGSIRHVELDRVVTVESNVTEGSLPNDVLARVQEALKDHEMPRGYAVRFTGENKDQQEAASFLAKALLAALFMITLVLVTQFNSILQPMVIVASVALSLIGVLWGLILTGTPFGIIMVGIGIISLAGVVVNNAIVLIDYTNQLRARGYGQTQAVITAGLVRFRPVMLTAVTTVLGLMPMVVGVSVDFFKMKLIIGGGSVEMWGPMARSVAAGLTVATLLTLVVVPVMTTLAEDFGDFLSRVFSGSGEKGVSVEAVAGSTAAQSSKLGGVEEA